MACKAARATDEYHGWECEITGGACMFLIPNSKACAEKYGERPDAEETDPGQQAKTISEILQEVREDICDNYCKYRDTSDEDCLCDKIRDGGNCPLDRLT